MSILLALGLTSANPSVKNVSPDEFHQMASEGGVQILDVRTPQEFKEGHIEGALLADYSGKHFKEEALNLLKKDSPVALYCRSGRRSAAAAEILSKEGFTVYNLETGILGWISSGKPTTKSMTYKEIVSGRYSCKRFSDKQLSKVQLEAILEAGRLAPTAKNLQEQHIYVVQSAEALAKIDSVTPCRYGAPTCIVVAFNSKNVFTYPGGKRDSGVEDASIVATHMILAAEDAGVDSCWINYFDPEKMKEALGLPEDEEVLMIMDLGFAAEGAGPLPNHSSRKPLSETVTYL